MGFFFAKKKCNLSVSDRYQPIWKKIYRHLIGSADLKNGIYRCISVSADMKKSLSVVPWTEHTRRVAEYILKQNMFYLLQTSYSFQIYQFLE